MTHYGLVSGGKARARGSKAKSQALSKEYAGLTAGRYPENHRRLFSLYWSSIVRRARDAIKHCSARNLQGYRHHASPPGVGPSRWLQGWGFAQAGLLLATVLSGLIAAWIAYGEVSAELDARLADAGVRVEDEVLTLEREHLILLRAITYTQGLPEALATSDATALQRLVTPLQANADIPLVDVVDKDGMVVLAVRGEGAPAPTASRAEWTAVQRALAGQRDAQGERQAALVLAPEGPLLATAGAVRLHERIVGAVVAATPLTDLIDRAGGSCPPSVTIYTLDGWPVATNSDTAPPAIPPSLAATIVSADAPSIPRSVSIGTSLHRELLGRFIVRQEVAGLLGVALPDNSWAMAFAVALPVFACLPATLVALALLRTQLGKGGTN